MTRAGTAALLTALLGLGGGAALGWPALVLVGAGLAAVLLLCGLLVARPAGLVLERAVAPTRVTKGEVAIASLTYRQGWAGGTVTVVRQRVLTTGADDAAPAMLETTLPRLRRGEPGMRVVALPTGRRGVHALEPMEVWRTDPFAAFRVRSRFGGTETFLVQPRVLALRALPAGRRRHLEGPSSDTSPQGSVTFHRLREYVAGDDLRLVHWPSTARTGRLVVRHNVDTSQPYTVVLLDLRPDRYGPAAPGGADPFEEAVDVAASVVVAGGAGKAPVELRLTDGSRTGGTGSADLTPLLDRLTAVRPAPGDLSGPLLALRRLRSGTTLVVVTGRLEPLDLREVAGLRRAFETLVVVAVGPQTSPAVPFPGVRLLTGADAAEVAAGWNTPAPAPAAGVFG